MCLHHTLIFKDAIKRTDELSTVYTLNGDHNNSVVKEAVSCYNKYDEHIKKP